MNHIEKAGIEMPETLDMLDASHNKPDCSPSALDKLLMVFGAFLNSDDTEIQGS